MTSPPWDAAILANNYHIRWTRVWGTGHRPFKPVFLLFSPSLRFYHHKQEYETPDGIRKFPVWSPTINLGLTVYNAGIRPGRLMGLRIRMQSDDLIFDFHPEYVQDTSKLEELRVKSSKPPVSPYTMRKATEVHPWRGHLVPKDKPIQEALVFYAGVVGLRQIPVGNFTFCIEYYSELRKKWFLIEEYKLDLAEWMVEIFQRGDTIGLTLKGNVVPPQTKPVDRNNLILDEEIDKALLADE